ncbi:MAG: multicopper oxidase domain-containing protein [Bacteroidota bacterium]
MKKIKIAITLACAAVFGLGGYSLPAQSFYNQLPIPDTISADTIMLEVEELQHNFDPGGTTFNGTMIPTFSYNKAGETSNSYLGPTLIWRHGRRQWTQVHNMLPGQQTTVHWHGAHIPAHTDGGPHQVIDNGATWDINFDIKDATTTLWYHPHLHDFTYTQVEMGLSGLIYVDDLDDPARDSVPHVYNVDDFPLIIQNKTFNEDTATGTWSIDTVQAGHATQIVNGVVNPYLEVPAQMVRFRILDGSSRVSYLLGFGDSTGTKLPFWLVGADAGWVPEPILVDSFLTGPGIRNEVVFDFSSYNPGDVLYLWDFRSDMPGGIVKSGGSDVRVIELRVTAATGSAITMLPADLPDIDTFDLQAVDTTRVKELRGMSGQGNPQNAVPFSIDGNQYQLERVDDIIPLGNTEIWEIWNRSNVAHPFHIHDIHFKVIEVWDSVANDTIPIPVELQGPQDNIMVLRGQKVSFITEFSDFGTARGFNDFDSTYMYHCHILTHEDGYYAVAPGQSRDHVGMMQQFLGWDGTFVSNEEATAITPTVVFYPNPATHELNLHGESKRASEFCMFDLQGKLVFRKELAPFDGTKTFDVSHLQSGMYLVEWRSNGLKSTEKVIIHRD